MGRSEVRGVDGERRGELVGGRASQVRRGKKEGEK